MGPGCGRGSSGRQPGELETWQPPRGGTNFGDPLSATPTGLRKVNAQRRSGRNVVPFIDPTRRSWVASSFDGEFAGMLHVACANATGNCWKGIDGRGTQEPRRRPPWRCTAATIGGPLPSASPPSHPPRSEEGGVHVISANRVDASRARRAGAVGEVRVTCGRPPRHRCFRLCAA